VDRLWELKWFVRAYALQLDGVFDYDGVALAAEEARLKAEQEKLAAAAKARSYLVLRCPKCGQKLRFKNEPYIRRLKCLMCETEFNVSSEPSDD